MNEVSLPLIVGASLIDGINPCAFGVLIFLLAYLSRKFHSPERMLLHGIIYIFAVGLTYFVAGIILLPVIQSLRQVSIYAYFVLAILIGLAGLVEIKDFFFPHRGFSLQIFPNAAERIKIYVKKISDKLSTAFALGVFVALVELPCTGAVYIAVLALMSASGLTISNLSFLILYNFIFVLPLVAILYLVYKGFSTKHFIAWQHAHSRLMRLIAGLVLIGLALWMVVLVT